MRRLAQLTGLAVCLFTTAIAAPQLYTITIKVSPPASEPTTFIYNIAPGLEEKYRCSTSTMVTVCKVPAGFYRVVVLPYNGDYLKYDSADTPLKVNRSQTLKYDLKLKLSKMEMPSANEKPFDDLLLKITGTLQECSSYLPHEPSVRCAVSSMKVELIKQWVGLISSLHQKTPWVSRRHGDGVDTDGAKFDVNGSVYYLTMAGSETGKTFLRWSILGDL